jgi:hypothetical protein
MLGVEARCVKDLVARLYWGLEICSQLQICRNAFGEINLRALAREMRRTRCATARIAAGENGFGESVIGSVRQRIAVNDEQRVGLAELSRLDH